MSRRKRLDALTEHEQLLLAAYGRRLDEEEKRLDAEAIATWGTTDDDAILAQIVATMDDPDLDEGEDLEGEDLIERHLLAQLEADLAQRDEEDEGQLEETFVEEPEDAHQEHLRDPLRDFPGPDDRPTDLTRAPDEAHVDEDRRPIDFTQLDDPGNDDDDEEQIMIRHAEAADRRAEARERLAHRQPAVDEPAEDGVETTFEPVAQVAPARTHTPARTRRAPRPTPPAREPKPRGLIDFAIACRARALYALDPDLDAVLRAHPTTSPGKLRALVIGHTWQAPEPYPRHLDGFMPGAHQLAEELRRPQTSKQVSFCEGLLAAENLDAYLAAEDEVETP